MRRVRVEMIYHSRCADCAIAYRNVGRAIWRLHRSMKVDLELLPAPISTEPMAEHDFELHCLIQFIQRTGAATLMQVLMDSMVDVVTEISHREDVWDLAAQVGVEPSAASRIAADYGSTVHRALARATLIDPIQVPAFLIDDEHLLHGNPSPAFIHDVLETLTEPRHTSARNPWIGLSKWTS